MFFPFLKNRSISSQVMRMLKTIRFREILMRKTLFSHKICGYNISSRACAFHWGRLRLEILCLKPCAIRNSIPCVRLAHNTNKGWKIAVKNNLSEDEGKSPNDLSACEEGTEAVPHSVLISSLKHCSSVDEQVNEICSKVSLSKGEVENRKNFAQSLHDLLVPFFPHIEVSLFGSSINGCGFKGCDCDISINVVGRLNSGVNSSRKCVELPTVADVESGRIPLEDVACLPPRLLLRFARRVFRQYSKDIREPILLIKARHPILRFYNKKYNLFSDFSCGDNSSLRNTRIIRFVGGLDDRILPLVKILRYWGKHRGFIGDIDQFNSYAFSLIVVYFLQKISPPVLPPISELLEKSGYLLSGRVGDDELLLNDVKKFSPSKNTQTVAELLREFFFYYMYFDFSQVLCPLTSSSIHKMEIRTETKSFEFSTIAVQDPFRPTYNVTHAAAEKFCKLFLKSVLHSCKSYQNKDIWCPGFGDKWGISSLLDSSAEDYGISKESELLHTIKVPLQASMLRPDSDVAEEMWFQKVSKAITDVFEYGLLFECKPLNKINAHSDVKESKDVNTERHKKLILRVMCTAYHNVFSGRSNLRELRVTCNTPNSLLEKEHIISVNISQRKMEEKKKSLFCFYCECSELQNDSSTLLVTLAFQQNNYQPAVIVFLKEYLPKLVQHSL